MACSSAERGADREIGRGRSGVVYLSESVDGRLRARKVFGSASVTKAVQWLFLGSPNPYLWNEDAIHCALLRRQILAELVPHWLGPRVQVAGADEVRWNEEHGAFELHTELSPGRPLALRHPLRERDRGLRELVGEVSEPLQERLIDAGFDGLVWQAGKGNPVALNNWLLEGDGADGGTWRWIDLESGVPALAPLNPWALVSFYLPRSWSHGRPLFDDVDTVRLDAYLKEHASSLAFRLGPAGVERLTAQAAELARRQRAWKGLRRLDRSIGYRLATGSIDARDAEFYRSRPLRWYAREGGRVTSRALGAAGRLARRAFGWIGGLDPWAMSRNIGRFLASQAFRARVAKRYLGGRIEAWRERGQLEEAHATVLNEHLESEEAGSYLTDFGVHLAIKPFIKSIEYWLFPALYAMGLIGEATLAIVVLGGGAAARTAYTLGRLVQSTVRRRPKPWIALFVGTLPIFGNFAYPLQVVYSSTGRDDHLARFILYDGCARLGEHLPIWGGRDTLTEHVLNRLPELLPGFRR